MLYVRLNNIGKRVPCITSLGEFRKAYTARMENPKARNFYGQICRWWEDNTKTHPEDTNHEVFGRMPLVYDEVR